jgi:hypothetical protein
MRNKSKSLSPHPGPLPLGRGEGESLTGNSRRRHSEKNSRKEPRIDPNNQRNRHRAHHRQDAAVDLLILSDGTILIHNLTPAMAAILNEINPKDQTIQQRAFGKRR